MKKLRLIKNALSDDAINAIAQETLSNGGFVAAVVEPKDRKIGHRMPDSTVYAGTSADTGKEMYAAPTDTPLVMTFNEAADYAKKLNRETYLGHDDWRVPTKNELNVLFNNRAAIGGFDLSGSVPTGWYWSATPFDDWNAWCQRFSDGTLGHYYKSLRSSVRLVR